MTVIVAVGALTKNELDMRLDEQIEALQEPGESMRVSTIAIVSFAVFYMRRSIQRAGAATRYGRKVRTLMDIKTFKNSKNNRFFGKCSDPLTCCDWQLIFDHYRLDTC